MLEDSRGKAVWRAGLHDDEARAAMLARCGGFSEGRGSAARPRVVGGEDSVAPPVTVTALIAD